MGKRWARCAPRRIISTSRRYSGGDRPGRERCFRHGVGSGRSSKSVMPNATSMMDCNGHSPKYKDVKQDLGGLCTDPNGGVWKGKS